MNLPEIARPVERRLSVVPQQPMSLLRQSTDTREPEVPIPPELQTLLAQYRPTPLKRAALLEEELGLNARLYYKYEGANISGSHKLNTALAQAFYYRRAGVEHLVTGTGAGQWGSALAYACNRLGLGCTVFMVGASMRQKPQRPLLMELFGADVHASPSDRTSVGREAARRDPERLGTLAVATGEALEVAHAGDRVRFAVGSGENCVLLHQTVIGLEAIDQMDALGDFPDYVVACMGAGSNFGGVGLPFLRAARERGERVRLLAAEPTACPKLTRGKYAYDVNDFSGTTPITRMYTLGGTYTAPAIHAGGLRYHGTSPFLSSLFAEGLFDAVAVDEPEALRLGLLLAQTENILPAPESAYALAAAIDVARRNEGPEPIAILVNLSGHGMFDLAAYDEYKRGTLRSTGAPEPLLAESLRRLDRFNDEIEAARSAAGVPA